MKLTCFGVLKRSKNCIKLVQLQLLILSANRVNVIVTWVACTYDNIFPRLEHFHRSLRSLIREMFQAGEYKSYTRETHLITNLSAYY